MKSTTTKNRTLRLEPLVARWLMAADIERESVAGGDLAPLAVEIASDVSEFPNNWHNEELAGDVDGSETVGAADILVLINDISRHGVRPLNVQADPDAKRFVDVDKDGWLTPIDVLVVINLLRRASPELNIVVHADPESDPNSNGVVLQERISLRGQTDSRARVELHLIGETSSAFEFRQTTRADHRGYFQFDVSLPLGITKIELTAVDQLGRRADTATEIRRGDIVSDWNAAILNVVRDWTTISNDPYPGRIVPSQPPVVAKNLAMIHTALFDAMNAVEGRFESYLEGLPLDREASPIAAAATAAHRVASALYSDADELAVWDATLGESLATIPDDEARGRGIALGTAIGQAMLAARANDGSKSKSTYASTAEPGHWNRTAPDSLPPLLPQWPSVQPFAITRTIDFRPDPPPRLDSAEYAQAVDEVMRLGGFTSQERTADQTEVALFWADGGGTATPPGHWNQIASDISLTRNQTLVEKGRTFALLNLAMTDAGIVAWDAKYHYDLWRPIDAIRKASSDENPATLQVEQWLPLLRTPPFPSYTSGHSAFSQAAATVLSSIYGQDVSFTSTSDAHTGLTQRPLAEESVATRSFESFADAAAEAGQSRVYGGIHFFFDNTAGAAIGQAVGNNVINKFAPRQP